MNIELNFHKTDEEILETNQKWFKFYVYFPEIITLILGALFFLGGLIYSCEACDYLDFDEIIGPLLTLWVVGAIVSGIIYALTKLSMSHKILEIYYLKQIQENTTKKE